MLKRPRKLTGHTSRTPTASHSTQLYFRGTRSRAIASRTRTTTAITGIAIRAIDKSREKTAVSSSIFTPPDTGQ